MNVLRRSRPRFLASWCSSTFTKRMAGSGGACENLDKRLMKDRFIARIAEDPKVGPNKVTVVGIGSVGMAYTFGVLAKHITTEVCIVDSNIKKAKAVKWDLQHGSLHMHDAQITTSDEYSATADSQVYVITAGVPRIAGATRLDMVLPNTKLIETIVPECVKYSPNCIIVIVSNPVDVLTYVAWKTSGLPLNRIIGTGASLDTSRFRFFLSKMFGLPPSACNGCVIGEHGESSVIAWSGVTVAGVPLRSIDPNIGIKEDKEGFHKLGERVVKAAAEVVKGMGYTAYGVALNSMEITRAIIENTSEVIPVSTSVKGLYDFDKDIFLSVPCTLNANGAVAAIEMELTELELEQLKRSADILYKTQLKTGY